MMDEKQLNKLMSKVNLSGDWQNCRDGKHLVIAAPYMLKTLFKIMNNTKCYKSIPCNHCEAAKAIRLALLGEY